MLNDMKLYYRAVVIGGGIAGCSTLYHLVAEGWSDIVLVERDELTSGTTWHSAAQVTNFGTNQTMLGIKSHSIQLYKELAQDPEYPVDYNYADGGIRLASTTEQLDGYHHFLSMAKGMGIEFEVIDQMECANRHPLLNPNGIVGGLWDPHDGHIDPAQLCQSLARKAKNGGARIMRHTPVQGLSQRSDKGWVVSTPDHEIHCEIVIIAAGYRVNEVAAMMGIQLPIVSMEHQYLVTEPIQEIIDANCRIPLLRCPNGDFYSRQEKNGLLVGFYEQDCKVWGLEGIDPNFTKDLCPDDLARISTVFDSALYRLPVLSHAGIHTVINGPITYSADGLPIIGKIPGRQNAYVIGGLRAGLGEGGGHGWILAQIIAHGEACYDTWCLDPCRFGTYADASYTVSKAVEDYQNEFRFHLPYEHREAGRNRRTTKLTQVLRTMGAHFIPINGWERAAFFATKADYKVPHTYRRSSLHTIIASEVRHVQNHVGISELCGFNRIKISGYGVYDWLEKLSCSKVPKRIGQVGLCYFLNKQGTIKCEATLANLGDCYWYISAAPAEIHDLEWLNAHLPDNGSIKLHPLVEEYQAIVIAGPKSRMIIERILGKQYSDRICIWPSVTTLNYQDSKLIVYNLSYSGELSFELHIRSDLLTSLWTLTMDSGQDYKILPFGNYAIQSMRIEKGFMHWKADLLTEYNPLEAGLAKFVDRTRDYIGRSALDKCVKNGLRNIFCIFNIDYNSAHAQPGASILNNNKVVGTVTSADFGYRTDMNLAMGYIDIAALDCNADFSIEALDGKRPAKLLHSAPYDPSHTRLRN